MFQINEGSQTCSSCGTRLSEYFCFKCKHFTGVDKNPFHCDKCGICRYVVSPFKRFICLRVLLSTCLFICLQLFVCLFIFFYRGLCTNNTYILLWFPDSDTVECKLVNVYRPLDRDSFIKNNINTVVIMNGFQFTPDKIP